MGIKTTLFHEKFSAASTPSHVPCYRIVTIGILCIYKQALCSQCPYSIKKIILIEIPLFFPSPSSPQSPRGVERNRLRSAVDTVIHHSSFFCSNRLSYPKRKQNAHHLHTPSPLLQLPRQRLPNSPKLRRVPRRKYQ